MKPNSPKSKVIKVRADSLALHPTAQRELVPSKLKKIFAEMDLDAIGVLHAVEYPINGTTKLWIIDGQHRWHALMNHGFGEWQVEVKVHIDVADDARASSLFLKLNDRSPVGPYAKFLNELNAGIASAIGVERTARLFNLKIDKSCGNRKLACISSLRRVWNLDSGRALSHSLECLIGAFGPVASALEGKLIEGLGNLFVKYNGSIDKDALVKKLKKFPGGASGILGEAKVVANTQSCSLGKAVAMRIAQIYNVGRTSGRLE